MSPKASHRVRPGLSSAASLMTTLLISFDQEVLNQHLNLVTPEYPSFESPCSQTPLPFSVAPAYNEGAANRRSLNGQPLAPAITLRHRIFLRPQKDWRYPENPYSRTLFLC